MKNSQKELSNEVQSIESLRNIVQTYQEIAANRMQRVKDSVLRNREFLEGVRKIYLQVRTSYAFAVTLAQKKGIINKNGKTLRILLSANTKLYGSIIRDTFELFRKDLGNNDSDIVIIGRIGLQMYREAKLSHTYTYIEVSDSDVETEEIESIMHTIAEYEKIIVYHPKFEDILSQKPTATVISGTLELAGSNEKVEQKKFIFEPSLEKVLRFFEEEAVASIFEQSIFEATLSKYTARMISLENSIQSINQNLIKLNFQKRWLGHRLFNTKQLDSLTGMSLWKIQ